MQHPHHVWKTFYSKEQANKFRTDALAPCLLLAFCIKEAFPLLYDFGLRKLVSHRVCSSAHMEVMCSMLVNMKLTCFIKTAHVKSHVTHNHRHWQVLRCLPQGFWSKHWQISKAVLTFCHQPRCHLYLDLVHFSASVLIQLSQYLLFSSVCILSVEELTSVWQLELFVGFTLKLDRSSAGLPVPLSVFLSVCLPDSV